MPETDKQTVTQNSITNDIQLLHHTRSEEVQEIMGRMPSRIIRWGIYVIAVVMLVVLVGSYFFKYPDIIQARVIISATNPPVKIIARNSLPISRIMVGNNSNVAVGQVLGILSNTANEEHVAIITSFCEKIDTTKMLSNFTAETDLPTNLLLGELQPTYIALTQALQEYRFFLEHNSYGRKMGHLAAQSNYQSELSRELQHKNGRLKEQLQIQQLRFHTDSVLVADQVMSKIEYENARKDLLNQQMNAEGHYANILQSHLQEKEIQKNYSETVIELQSRENSLQQKIREAVKLFRGAQAQWEQHYVLRTPVAGTVSFFRFWKENQFVQAGEPVMLVAPKIQGYIARGELGILGAGKVKPGQKVLIRLIAYTYEEYGSLNGTLKSRSTVAMDSTFAIEITLDSALATNAGRIIPDQPQLQGMAEIITENKSILQRMFEQVYGKRRK